MKYIKLLIIPFLIYFYSKIFDSYYNVQFFEFSKFIGLFWKSIVYKKSINEKDKYKIKSIFIYMLGFILEVSGNYYYNYYIFGINNSIKGYTKNLLPFYILIYFLPKINLDIFFQIIVSYKHCYLTFNGFNNNNIGNNIFYFLITNIYTCKTSIFNRIFIDFLFNQNKMTFFNYIKKFKRLLFFGIFSFFLFLEQKSRFVVFFILILQNNIYI